MILFCQKNLLIQTAQKTLIPFGRNILKEEKLEGGWQRRGVELLVKKTQRVQQIGYQIGGIMITNCFPASVIQALQAAYSRQFH